MQGLPFWEAATGPGTEASLVPPPAGPGGAKSASPVGADTGAAAVGGEVGRLLAQLVQNPQQLHALRLVLGVR